MVQANRSDREVIASLIETLDSAETPQALAANQPRMVPIKNTDADEIQNVVEDVFESQLRGSMGEGGRRSSRGPLSPRLSVDRTSNSLVIRAPSPLADEIEQFAKTLDEAAGDDPSRRLRIVPLQKLSSDSVQDALDVILRDRSYRRGYD